MCAARHPKSHMGPTLARLDADNCWYAGMAGPSKHLRDSYAGRCFVSLSYTYNKLSYFNLATSHSRCRICLDANFLRSQYIKMHTFNLLDVLAFFLTGITIITAISSTAGNERDDLKNLSSALADAGVTPARLTSVESGSLVGANLHQPGFVGCAAAVGIIHSAAEASH